MKEQRVKHGRCRDGQWNDLTYRTWACMKERCITSSHPQDRPYKGMLCDRWRDFNAFLADMGERPGKEYSIDRIDNSRGYEPGNCRWATQLQQHNNKSNNRYITFNDQTHTLTEWSRIAGIHWKTLADRLDRGWGTERALTEPAGNHSTRRKN